MNDPTTLSTMEATARGTSAWKPALAALSFLLLLILLLYRDTAVAMVGIWYRSETFAHAFIVPPISLWLVWRLRELLVKMTPRPALWMLLPMALVALVWLAGDLVVVNAVTQFALVAMLVLAVPLVLGLQVSRVIGFPLGFLFFAVPIGEFLVPVLMESTADFTVAALKASGIPVYREGNQFVIPSGNWSVVEACSGVRYLIASLMVGTLFAYLNYRSMLRRWVFVGISILVPIVANWVRAYMIVMLGHLSDNKLAVGVDHLIYGWVFFGVVIMLMFMIGARWSELAEVRASAAMLGVGGSKHSAAVSPAISWRAAVAGVLATAIGPAMAAGLWRGDATAPFPTWTLPASFGQAWVATEDFTDWKPEFQNPRMEVRRPYQGTAGAVGVHVAQFRNQSADSKLVSSDNALVQAKASLWNRHDLGSVSVVTPNGAVMWRATRLQGAPSLNRSITPEITIWQLYLVDGRFTTSDPMAKVYTALSRLGGRGDDGATILLYVKEPEAAQAAARLERFARENLPAIVAQINDVSQRR